jgi:hypothetical protein
MGQSPTQAPFEAPPQPVGCVVRDSPVGQPVLWRACLADPWRVPHYRASPELRRKRDPRTLATGAFRRNVPISSQTCLADRWPATPLALTLEGLVLLVPSPAEGSAANLTFKLSLQPAGSRLPRRSLAACRPFTPSAVEEPALWRGLREESTVPLSSSLLLEATKTNLLGPFLIATRTRVVNAQLPYNQQDRYF